MRNTTNIIWTVLVLSSISCGKKDDKDSDEPSTNSLELTATEALDFTSLALSSSMSGTTASTLSSSGALVTLAMTGDDASTQSEFNKKCSNKTEAWDESTDDVMTTDNKGWAGRTFVCKFNGPASSPESVRGAFLLGMGIIKAAQSLVSGDNGFEFTEKEQTVSGKLKLEKKYFGDFATQVSDMKENDDLGEMTFKYKKLTDNKYGWQNQISYTRDGEEVTIGLNISGEVISIGTTSGWAVSIDVKNQRLSYELMDKRFDRHVAMMIEGTLNKSTGEMTDITKIQGIYSGEYNVATIMGTAADGYITRTYQAAAASQSQKAYKNLKFSDFSEVNDRVCMKAEGDCTDAAGMKFESDTELKNFIYFTDRMDATLGMLAMKPVNFESVTFSKRK